MDRVQRATGAQNYAEHLRNDCYGKKKPPLHSGEDVSCILSTVGSFRTMSKVILGPF